jgi:hypothetical protein
MSISRREPVTVLCAFSCFVASIALFSTCVWVPSVAVWCDFWGTFAGLVALGIFLRGNLATPTAPTTAPARPVNRQLPYHNPHQHRPYQGELDLDDYR